MSELGYEFWICRECLEVSGDPDPDHVHGPTTRGYWLAAEGEPGELSVAEFRELGYLQEVNRLILHPLGLALVASSFEGFEVIRGVRDERADPEGIYYAPGTIPPDEQARAHRIETEAAHRAGPRLARLGYVVQPIEST